MKNTETMSGDHFEPVELVDWFSQGESCELTIGGTSVVVRFIGRKGRRARIAVSATPVTGLERTATEAVRRRE